MIQGTYLDDVFLGDFHKTHGKDLGRWWDDEQQKESTLFLSMNRLMRQQPTSHGFTHAIVFYLYSRNSTRLVNGQLRKQQSNFPCHQPKDRWRAPIGTAMPLLCKRCRSPHIDKQQNQNSYAHASIHQEGTNCTYHLELLRLWRESMKSES